MKTLLCKWRGLQIAAAMAAAVLPLQSAELKTLGGGPNNSGFSSAGFANGNTLLNAKFSNPYSVAQDQGGNLFVADRNNNKVRKITKPGQADSMTTTFKSMLPMPVGVAVDSSNNVYVLTAGDGKLRKYSNSGRLLRTVGRLINPTALAVGTNFAVYVVELGGSLKKIPMVGPTELLGPGGFNQPRGIAVLQDGRLAITTSRNHAIYTVDQETGEATLLAGGNGAGYNDGPGGLAQFNGPYGIATAPSGSLVVADRNNHRVRLVATNSTVTTLFGVARSQWASDFAGWSDGSTETAASRSPVGVAVGRDGTVYDTEVFWHLIRQATGLALGSTGGGPGVSTNVVGTNTFVGTNIISLGFQSGEGSADFIGAAGQTYFAPVTLTLAPGQKVYSFQMSLYATNESVTPLDSSQFTFASTLMQSVGGTFYAPIDPNFVFSNTVINLLGVGWLERYEGTDLYNTLQQDLVSFSIAKDTLFLSSAGKVIMGAFKVPIPSSATETDTYRVQLRNPSGTQDGVSQPVPLRIPTDGSLGSGAINSIKRITLASRPYIVGDTAPFRWFNAGEFGDSKLENNDVIQIFETAWYGWNAPLTNSDLYMAMDVSDGYGTNTLVSFGDDISINSITNSDGLLMVDDIYVTFRRSLDPSLKWFARYWSNGLLQTVEYPNALATGFDAPVQKVSLGNPTVADVLAVRPAARLSVNGTLTTPGASLQFPVSGEVTNGYALRVMMLSVTLEALDGSPAVTLPVEFQTTPGFEPPQITDTRKANTFAGAWLKASVAGFSGSGPLGLLSVDIPVNAGPGAAYRVHFNHFSGSPNGYALFNAHTSDGLILLSDRSASTWNDGISDAWRLLYFASIFSSDSALGADPDGDGVINSIEYANQTDPTDPLSN